MIMTTKTGKRRSPGEGSTGSYMTKAGVRWYWKATLTMADGTKKIVWKRGFLTKTTPKGGGPAGAPEDMREAQAASGKQGYAAPSKQPFGEYLTTWLASLRLAPSTAASYKRNVRVHIAAYPIASVPLGSLTPAALTAHYRMLEASGLRGSKGERTGKPMSARSVRYLHTVVSSALKAAVMAGQIPANPAARANPPSAKQAKAPEMLAWSAAELGQFLSWSAEHSTLHTAWYVLATTGMRRGELLGLRWRDLDLDKGRITIRRSAVPVRVHGERGTITEGPPKSGKPRVVTIDSATVALLRSWKRDRGLLALTLVQADAIVFGTVNGEHLSPERVTRNFGEALAQCRKELPDLPVITLHGLRHTHVSVLLSSGVPVKTVSARIGHSTPLVTMSIYAHLLEGDDEAASDMFASLVGGAEVAERLHGQDPGPAQQAGEAR
jgi:integrase